MKSVVVKEEKKMLSAEEVGKLMGLIGDLIDDAEIKLIVSMRLSKDGKEQLRLANAANGQLRRALMILLAQSEAVKESDEWRYWYEMYDMARYSALKRLAEVEYGMAGNKSGEKKK